MQYTISFTPESVMNFLNRYYDEKFTLSQIEDNWDQITDYIENWHYNIMYEDLWTDFSAVAEEWGIDLFVESEY